mmetsp:Transcript_33989/g.88667  ORF Transcript_33989/g.88667 Transcript_33989/m.88667 type:complete len:311 (-) Transcript_33989:22-954(-)
MSRSRRLDRAGSRSSRDTVPSIREDPPKPKDAFKIRRVRFNRDEVCILLQDWNGPCPMLAVLNFLSLTRQGIVHKRLSRRAANGGICTAQDLQDILRDHVQSLVEVLMEVESPDEERLKNLTETVDFLPSIMSGMNVDPGFDRVSNFADSVELRAFQALQVPLLHALVCGPDDSAHNLLLGKTYNQAMDVVVTNSEDGLRIQEWIDRWPLQSTPSGLLALRREIPEGGSAVLFHNCHFSLVHKRRGRLYTLVTDEGIVGAESFIVWSSLSDCWGDLVFLDAEFRTQADRQTIAHKRREEGCEPCEVCAVQ